jgi:sec-independent protein translocase protein TatA
MGIGVWELLIILAIVLLIFGGKRLANLGKDLGSAIKGFKQSMKDGDESARPEDGEKSENRKLGSSGRVVDGDVVDRNKNVRP